MKNRGLKDVLELIKRVLECVCSSGRGDNGGVGCPMVNRGLKDVLELIKRLMEEWGVLWARLG